MEHTTLFPMAGKLRNGEIFERKAKCRLHRILPFAVEYFSPVPLTLLQMAFKAPPKAWQGG
jgi:hypothetical protein